MNIKYFILTLFITLSAQSCFKNEPVDVNYQFVRFNIELNYDKDFTFTFYEVEGELFKSNIYSITVYNNGEYLTRPISISTESTGGIGDFEVFYTDCEGERVESGQSCRLLLRAIKEDYGKLSGLLRIKSGEVTKEMELHASNVFPERPFISYWRTFEEGKSDSNQIELPLRPFLEYDFVVDWGDGNESHITSWDDPQKRHTYEKPGEYRITLSGKLPQLGPIVKNDIRKIVSDYSHQCLLDRGVAKCWGGNFRGRLGYGDERNRSFSEAIYITGASPIIDISVGSSHTCLLYEAGHVNCVGGGGGTGRLGFYSEENVLSFSDSSTLQFGLGNPVTLLSHLNSTCVIHDNNDMECWGDTWRIDENQFLPHASGGRQGYLVSNLESSLLLYDDFMCLILDGYLNYCWGDQFENLYTNFEAFGNRSRNFNEAQIFYHPNRVTSLTATQFNNTVDSQEIHRRKMCAVYKDGSFSCWGSASSQGGNRYPNTFPAMANPISLDENVIKIVHGGIHPDVLPGPNYFTCLLLEDGTVRCWGTMHNGIEVPFSDPYIVAFDEPIIDISAIDRANKVCGLLESGKSFCFGGDYDSSLSPFMYGSTSGCSPGFCYADEVELNARLTFLDHDMNKLARIESWGTNKWQSFRQMFRDYTLNPNIILQADDLPRLEGIAVDGLKEMFMGADVTVDFSEWDLSSVSDMSYIFKGATVDILNISNWPTSNMINLSGIFSQALIKSSNESNLFVTSSATNMNEMFAQVEGLEHLNLVSLDTSNVESMKKMFYQTSFDQNISGWNVFRVRDMREMFKDSSFNRNIGGWNTSSLSRADGMFQGNTEFDQDLQDWNMTNVISLSRMFKDAINFNGNVSTWNTSNVQDMSETFSGAERFNSSLNGWTTSSTYYVSGMFKNAINFNQSVSHFDDRNFRAGSSMFEGAESFNQSLASWDLNDLFVGNSMFENATAFNNPISGSSRNSFSSLADARSMFEGAESFNQNLYSSFGLVINANSMFKNAEDFNGEMPNFNSNMMKQTVSMFEGASSFNRDLNASFNQVLNANSMFKNATSYNGRLNLTGALFERVTDTSSMFEGATSFNRFISTFSMSNNYNTSNMFLNASSFDNDGSLGIRNWDVSQVEDMSGMFAGATSFNRELNEWWDKVGNVVDFSGMFEGSNYNQDLSAWLPCSASDMSFMFANYDPSQSYTYDLSPWSLVVNSNSSIIAPGYEDTACFDKSPDSQRLVTNCDFFDFNGLGNSFDPPVYLPVFGHCSP